MRFSVRQHAVGFFGARQKNTTQFVLIPTPVADGFLQLTIYLKKIL